MQIYGRRVHALTVMRLCQLKPEQHSPGLPTEEDSEVATAVRSVQAQGASTVLVKRGARGSTLYDGSAPPVYQPAFSAIQVFEPCSGALHSP